MHSPSARALLQPRALLHDSHAECVLKYQSAEQVSTDPVKLTWRQGTPAPVGEMSGAAVVHCNTAYFSQGTSVYSYTLSQDKWTELKQCKYKHFSMAVVDNQLTTIGGQHASTSINCLLCLSRSSSEIKWEELLPPMPTRRIWSAAVTTPTHLIVAGGQTQLFTGKALSVVETLDTNTLQWSSVSSSPEALHAPNVTLCNGQLTQQDLLVLCGRSPQVLQACFH